MNKIIIVFGLFLIHCAACNSDKTVQVSPLENINKGSLRIATDESLQSLSGQLGEVFMNQHAEAQIQFKSYPGSVLVAQAVKDSFRVLMMGRKLTDTEKKFIVQHCGKAPVEHVFGYDALAFLVSSGSSYRFTAEEFAHMLELAGRGEGNLQLVLDDASSGLLSSFMQQTKGLANAKIFGVNGPDSVAAFVRNHPNYIGVLSWSAVSDEFSSSHQRILEGNRLLSFERGAESILISQSSIADSSYPFIRPINYVIANSPERVSNGFANFLHRNKSAKVLLRSGLVPRIFPEREFSVTSRKFQIQ